MAIYSPKYPIEYDFGAPGDFVVSVDTFGNVIFKGYTFSGKVDISGICQSYMNASLVDVPNEIIDEGYFLDIETDSVVKRFFIGRSEGPAYYFDVANDYNDDWIPTYDSDYITSYSVTGKYHPDDLVFIDVNSPDKTATIESNVISGSLTGFNSAHVTAKKAREEGEGVVVEEIENNLSGGNPDAGLSSIAYNNGYYVGARRGSGAARGIAITEYLPEWDTVRLQRNTELNFCEYINNIFLVGGLYTAYSFTPLNTPVVLIDQESTTFYDTCYSAGYYLLLSKSNSNNGVYVYNSQNLTTWGSNGYNRSDNVATIAANRSGRVIFMGANGIVFNSPTTPPTLASTNVGNIGSTDFSCYKVRFYNDIFVACGSNNSGNIGRIWKSDINGQNWTLCLSDDTSGIFDSCAYGNGLYAFISRSGYMYYTTDLSVFETIYLERSYLTDILFDGEKFVISTSRERIYTVEIKSASLDTISVNGQEIIIEYTAGCEEYTIYWVNKQGGRSQLLVEGNTNERTSNTNYEIRTNYDRLDPASFEYRRIYNDVNREYTFDLGWLTDEQYLQINDLMNSPKIWIHDHKTDRIISARLAGNTDNINNFVSNRNASKTITLREAQNHIRR